MYSRSSLYAGDKKETVAGKLNPSVPKIEKGKELFYVTDTTADLSNFNKTTSEKFKFPDVENKSSLLQLFFFSRHPLLFYLQISQNKAKIRTHRN